MRTSFFLGIELPTVGSDDTQKLTSAALPLSKRDAFADSCILFFLLYPSRPQEENSRLKKKNEKPQTLFNFCLSTGQFVLL